MLHHQICLEEETFHSISLFITYLFVGMLKELIMITCLSVHEAASKEYLICQMVRAYHSSVTLKAT
jgi:hypothetical protein